MPLERERRHPGRFKPSKNLYRFTYSVLVDKYGEKCQNCGKAPPEVRLEIDHPDGRRETWVVNKLRLLCRRCNRLRRHPAKSHERKREYTEERSPENISYEARRSLELGPTFELELDRLLMESEGGITVREAQNRLGKICGCDQQTVGRWLDREATPEGKYVLSERTVTDGRRKRTMQFVGRK